MRDEKHGWTREDTVDRELGMSAPITRRDALHGMGAAALGAVAAPWLTLGCRSAGNVETVVQETRPYPPGNTGLRGDHPVSFDVAHQRAWKPYIDAAIDQAHRAVGEFVEAGLV